MKTRTAVRLFAAFLVLLLTMPAGAAEEAPLQSPALKRLYAELQTLFRKHYPKATSHLLKEKIHFEQDTRIFLIHEPWMTGEWQDPQETRGPKPGGILCEITLKKGPYAGQAAVPQTFDKRYFKILLTAPYSPKHDAHLRVQLSYPGNAREDFLKEFGELVQGFGRLLD